MDIAIGDSVTLDFTTTNPLTGQVSDTDFLPTCDVFKNTTDVPLISPIVGKRVGFTGDYRVSFDATVANGFTADKSYNVIVTATVAGIRAKAPIASFILASPISFGAVLPL